MYKDTIWTKHCVGVYGVVPIFRGVPIYGDTPIYGGVRVPVSPNIGTPLNWMDVPIVVLISWTDQRPASHVEYARRSQMINLNKDERKKITKSCTCVCLSVCNAVFSATT